MNINKIKKADKEILVEILKEMVKYIKDVDKTAEQYENAYDNDEYDGPLNFDVNQQIGVIETCNLFKDMIKRRIS